MMFIPIKAPLGNIPVYGHEVSRLEFRLFRYPGVTSYIPVHDHEISSSVGVLSNKRHVVPYRKIVACSTLVKHNMGHCCVTIIINCTCVTMLYCKCSNL